MSEQISVNGLIIIKHHLNGESTSYFLELGATNPSGTGDNEVVRRLLSSCTSEISISKFFVVF